MTLKRILYFPVVERGSGLGNVLRSLALSFFLKDEAEACFYLPASFPDISDISEYNVKRINETQLSDLIPCCDAIILDNQNPAEVQLTVNKIRQIVKNIPIIALDYTGDTEGNIDVCINLRSYSKSRKKNNSTEKYFESLDYAIIRKSFLPFRPKKLVVKKCVKDILISFGGEDIAQRTLSSILWLENCISEKLNIKVVVGALNKQKKEISAVVDSDVHHNYIVLDHLLNIEYNMSKCDLAFCGAGTMLMELAFLGKVGIVVPQNSMERSFSEVFKEKGYIPFNIENNLLSMQSEPLIQLFNDIQLREKISRIGMDLIDGQGAVRIANIVLSKISS